MTKVMVVEDNEIIRNDIIEGLESLGSYSVRLRASSAREAISIYDRSLADVVLMDIELEGATSGLDAARSIIAVNPEAVIIYLTSHDDEDLIITAMATGARDFLVKGCDAASISEHITACLNGNANLDERVQSIIMREYKRLRDSEQSLLYFIHHLSSLTNTERELIACFLEGMKIKDIAQRRFVEPSTVKSQVRTLLQKFSLSRTSEIVTKIRELKLEHLFPVS